MDKIKALSPPELADFAARLRAAQLVVQETKRAREERAKTTLGMGLAWRISLEFVVAVAMGSGLGWLLDSGLGTRPWFLLLFLFLGGAAGVMNTYRVAHGLDESIGFGQAMRR